MGGILLVLTRTTTKPHRAGSYEFALFALVAGLKTAHCNSRDGS